MISWFVLPVAVSLGFGFGVLGGRDLMATSMRIAAGGGRASAMWGLARRLGMLVAVLAVTAWVGPMGCFGAGVGYVAGFVLIVMRGARASGR